MQTVRRERIVKHAVFVGRVDKVLVACSPRAPFRRARRNVHDTPTTYHFTVAELCAAPASVFVVAPDSIERDG